jgi:hypothetical protein
VEDAQGNNPAPGDLPPGFEAGGAYWYCLSAGVVYPGPILPAVLGELLFPGDWLIPPVGPDQG